MLVVPDLVLLSMLANTVANLGSLAIFLMLAPVVPGPLLDYATAHSGVSGWADLQPLSDFPTLSINLHVAQYVWPRVTFTNDTGIDALVYGYAVCDAAGTTLLWAEDAGSGPVTLPDSLPYVVWPFFSLENQT